MANNPFARNNLFKTTIFTVYVLLIVVLVPATIGFAKGGFNIEGGINDINSRFFFFGLLALVSGVIIIGLTWAEKMVNKGDTTYGEGMGYFSPGLLPHPPFLKKYLTNQIPVTLITIIVMMILGLTVGLTEQSFFGITEVQQSFTKFDNALFNSLLNPGAENLEAAAFLAAFLFGLRMLARKTKMTRTNFIILAWVGGLIVFTGFGVLNHLARYGFDDQSLSDVAGTWFVGGLIIMLTGMFLIFWIMHIINNIFVELGKLYGNDTTTIIIVAVLFGLVALLIWYYYAKGNKKASPIT